MELNRKKVDVYTPLVFQNYNNRMVVVDQAYKSVAVYTYIYHLCELKKWRWVIFTYMLLLSVAEAWPLHLLTAGNSNDQLQSRRSKCRNYLRYTDDEKAGGKLRKPSLRVSGINLDNLGHISKKLASQLIQPIHLSVQRNHTLFE